MRLTLAEAHALLAAATAMEAGLGPGEGDWPEDVKADTLESAIRKLQEKIEHAEHPKPNPK